MPYWEPQKQRWRAQVVKKGYRYRRQFPTKREAIEWEVEERKKRKKSELQDSHLNMSSFVTQYLKDAEKRFCEKVFKEKMAVCGIFLDQMVDMPVDEVTPRMIQDYLWKQANERSNNASNKDRKNLMAMWNWGVRVLSLEANPVAKIGKLPHDMSLQYTPSPKEIERLLVVATVEERVFLTCYLHTAARRGEVFRLTWEDVNWEREEIRLGTRKTKDGSMEYEWLPMSEQLIGSLWYWYWNRPIGDTPYIFVSTSKKPARHYGQPYRERRWFMEQLCKRAGVRVFGFHALRRYAASVLAGYYGVASKTIQRILRHKNLATTERYIHSVNNDLRVTMNLFREPALIKNPTGSTPPSIDSQIAGVPSRI